MSTRPVAIYTDVEDVDVTAGVKMLEHAGYEVRVLGTRDPEKIVAESQDAEVLLVGYAEIGAEHIARLPNLKLIALLSMGFNNIDIDAAAQHGVWVTNVPGAATEEVATHSLAALLYFMRNLRFYLASANPSDWNLRDSRQPLRLSELTLGVVGLGKIGRKFAELCRPLFGRVVGYDPMLPDTPETRELLAESGVARLTLDEVRSAADVLSLNVPLTEDTHHLVNAEFIAGMRDGSVIVNPSRGQLLDVSAVSQALDSGKLSGLVLDVLETEPPAADHPFLGRDNVVLTPHIAYYSNRTDSEYVRIQAQNAVSWLTSGTPDSPVNSPKGGQ